MPRIISLGTTREFNLEHADHVAIVLVKIDHDDLAEPVYLSTDPTIITSYEPLTYGTISNGITYDFAGMSAVFPDDKEGSPVSAQLALDNVNGVLAPLFRGISSPPVISMSLVMSSDLDFVEESYEGLQTDAVDYDAMVVSLSVSRDPSGAEPLPNRRMVRSAFPALYEQ